MFKWYPVINNRLIYLRKIQGYKVFASQHTRKLCFLGGAIVATASIGVCSCQTSSMDVHYPLERLWSFYDEKVVHSSFMRFGRASFTVVSVMCDYKYSLFNLDRTTDQYKSKKSECHQRSADKFKSLCSINGGVFMKIAQHIGSLDFLFPKEYTETLRCFQNKAPESSFKDVRRVIESETGCTIEEIFLEFDRKSLGSASLAQVHRAVLKTGEVVAVKVQHRTVKKHAFADANVIEFFVKVASKIFTEFQFQWLVDQIKTNLPLETNFLNEGKNCEKMGDMLNGFSYLKVPTVYWKHSTSCVLVMEHCEGGIVDDVKYIQEHGINVNEISAKLSTLYSEMIFVRGFIHCDPHAGNILVRKNKECGTEIILLDHGLYQTLSDQVRLAYCNLWQSLITADLSGIKTSSQTLGVGEYYGLFACIVAGRSWESIQSGIQNQEMTNKELNEIQTNAVHLAATITEVLEKLPREMVLIFKTNDLLRGLEGRLGTRTHTSFITMSHCCLRALYAERLSSTSAIFDKLVLYFEFYRKRIGLWLYEGLLYLSAVKASFYRV